MIPAPYTCSPTRRISSSLYYNGFLAADINGIFPHPQTQEALYSFLVLWTWLDREKDVSLLICCTFLYQSSLMTNVYIFSTCIYILNFFCIHADDANRDTCQCFWQKWNVVLINSFLLRNSERTKKNNSWQVNVTYQRSFAYQPCLEKFFIETQLYVNVNFYLILLAFLKKKNQKILQWTNSIKTRIVESNSLRQYSVICMLSF